MKKLIKLMFSLFLIITLISCENDKKPANNEENNEKPQFDYTCITTDKNSYTVGEKITVYLHNTDSNDLLAITEYGREPTNQFVLSKRQVKDTKEQTFNTEKLNGIGDYTIFLYENGYEVIYSLDIHVNDDDTNNYKISNAKLNVSSDLLSSNVSIETSFTNELTYRLYWAKDNKRLNGYMALKTYKSSELSEFIIELPNNLFMPNEANQIEISVVEGISESYFLNVNDSLKIKESKHILTFNAISDLHIQSRNDSPIFNSHLRLGLKDIYSSNSDAIFVVGDIINMSELANYSFYKSILDEQKENAKPIYYSLGNHEYMYQKNMTEALNMFKEQFNYNSHYYSVELKGYKFIVLGSDDIGTNGKMNPVQINWLKNELANTDKNKSTFIFLHQGLKDTVAGTLETKFNQKDYGFGAQSETLRGILKDYPNAIVFSGHSHYTLEEYQTVLYGNGVDASFVNCGAMAYLNANGLEDVGGAEGYYVEVYEDYILLRGKEFVYDKWISTAQFVFPIIK